MTNKYFKKAWKISFCSKQYGFKKNCSPNVISCPLFLLGIGIGFVNINIKNCTGSCNYFQVFLSFFAVKGHAIFIKLPRGIFSAKLVGKAFVSKILQTFDNLCQHFQSFGIYQQNAKNYLS